MVVKPLTKGLKSKKLFSKSGLTLFAVAFAFIGGYFIISSFAASSQSAQALSFDSESYASNEILIKVKDSEKSKVKDNPSPGDTGLASLDDTNKTAKVKKIEKVGKVSRKSKADEPLMQWYKVTLDKPRLVINSKNSNYDSDLQFIIGKYKKDPAIAEAQPNFIYQSIAVPNDPYYSSAGAWGQTYDDLWGMKKINGAAAWDQTTGSANIVVADVDTGVDRNHEDLKDNMWVNTAEVAGNGIDDDHNGFVDDYYGWDFANNDNDPLDDHGHGSHTVGTIAGKGNNGVGVVGVNWNSKVMAVKGLDKDGSGYSDRLSMALQYAADMGARVSSNSWGGSGHDQMMEDAVIYEHSKGVVPVFAAGNSNADALDFNPASVDDAVTVAASDWTDSKASFSNYGSKIDVAAPGVNILSVKANIDPAINPSPMCTGTRVIGTNYCYVSGTSMATPHVAGLAALILAKNPSLTNEEVRQVLRTGATDLGAVGKDSSFGFGRIDANASLNLAAVHPLAPYISSPRSRTILQGSSIPITGSVNGSNFASYKLEFGLGRTPTSWTTVTNSTTQPTADGILGTVDTSQLADGLYTARLTATTSGGQKYEFSVYDLTIDHFDGSIASPGGQTSLGTIGIYGSAITKNGTSMANYKVEWSSNNSTWVSTGISLTNGGTVPIPNGKLGDWDTSQLTNGQTYYLRLTITSTVGTTYQATSQVTADKDMVVGWPKTYTYDAYQNCTCNLAETMADLNGDGKKEIIIPGPDGKIYVYNKDGTDFPGFPAGPINSGDIYNNGNVNVADLDGDGKKEIILVAHNSSVNIGQPVYIVRYDGTPLPGWTPPIISPGDRIPAVADLNGDGQKEIIIVSLITWSDRSDLTVNAYRPDSTQISGFPKSYRLPAIGFDTSTQMYPSNSGGQSVVDLDNDGKPEITWSFANRIYLFDNQGNIVPGWPYIVPPINNSLLVFESNLASGDALGNGQKQLFAYNSSSCGYSGTSLGVCYIGNGGTAALYVFNKDGSVVSGWPKTTATDGLLTTLNNGTGTMAVADIDNDNKDELIGPFQSLGIFDIEGKKNLTGASGSYSQPALADVDGDGNIDIATNFSNSTYIAKQNGTQFTELWRRNINIGSNIFYKFFAPPVMSDIDNNGKMEFGSVAGSSGISNGITAQSAQAYLWEIPPTSGSPKYEWTMLNKDPNHSSRLALSSTPLDTTPPTVTFTAPTNGSTVSGTVNVTANASDNVAVSRVEFSVDGVLKATATSSPYSFAWDSLSVTNGTHTLAAKVFDSSNNLASDSISVNVANTDTTPPSTPTGLNATAAAYNKVNLSWTASTDNVGVAGYYIVRGGVTIANSVGTGTTYSDSTVNASTSYTYQVMAYDAKSNTSSLSNTASVFTPTAPDTTAPSAPANLIASAVSSSQINLTWSASSDNVGVTAYDVYRNGTKLATVSTTSYGNTGLSASTAYTYYVVAKDAAGNQSPQSSSAQATTQAPQATTGVLTGTVSSSTGGVVNSATVAITFSGSKHSYSTNSSGVYNITGIPGGTYDVKYTDSRYTAQTVSVSITNGQTTTRNITLQRK